MLSQRGLELTNISHFEGELRTLCVIQSSHLQKYVEKYLYLFCASLFFVMFLVIV